MASNTKVSSASAVRTWLLTQDAETVGTVGGRGKFSAKQVEAFNAAHPRAKYVSGAGNPRTTVVKMVTVDKRGRKRSTDREVPTAEIRAAAVAAGMTGASRGRLSAEVITAYGAGFPPAAE